MIPLLLLLAAVCEGRLQGTAPETRCVLRFKTLECKILTADAGLFNCTVFSHAGSDNPLCPNKTDRHRTSIVNRGMCHFHCDSTPDCLINHWLIFDKLSPFSGQTETSCKVVQTQRFVKAEPVQDLTVTYVNSTTVEITFKKPDAVYKKNFVLFKYKVKYKSRNPEFSGQQSLRKRSDLQVTVTLGNLQPGENYSISVFARPKSKGYRSEARTKWVQTPEDVPLSGPTVPEGAFTVYKHHLVLYLKKIPLKERRGRIQHYKVSIDQCDHQNITSRDQYWSVINTTSCSNESFEVQTSASTSAGWSKNPSLFLVNPQLYSTLRLTKWSSSRFIDMALDKNITTLHPYTVSIAISIQMVHFSNKANHVEYVYKKENELVWSFPRTKPLDSFSIFSCYGKQDPLAPQLMKCKVPIENVTVSAKDRSMPLVDRDTPEMICSLCEWHYGVSVILAGSGAGITWNAPVGKELLSESGLKTIFTVVATLMSLCVAVVVVILIWWLVRYKTLCRKVTIVLPKTPSFMFADEITSVSRLTSDDSSKPNDKEKLPIRCHRDSGNSSMTTLRLDSEETKRLTSMTEEDKDEQLEEGSCQAYVWTTSNGEDGMWSSTDTSAMSDYRQVAGAQQEPEVLPVMYSDVTSVISGSDVDCDSSVPTTTTTTDTSASTTDTSAPTIDRSASTLSAGKNTGPSARQTAKKKREHCITNHNELEETVGLDQCSQHAGSSGSSLSDTHGEIFSHKSIEGDITRQADLSDETMPLVRIKDTVLMGKDKRSHQCDANDTEASIGSYAEFDCDAV